MITTDINFYNISEALEAVRAGVESYLMKDPNTGNYILDEFYKNPLFLEGPPGIGKTEGVRQVADELGIGFVSFSLTHHTRNSLLGLPAINEREIGEIGGKYTSYTMSEIIAKVYDEVNAGHKEGILLLDEFPCMSSTIMPAMLAFLQTKNIGTHTLPEGWVIVLCGNPPEFNKHSTTFDAAVTDRLRTLRIAWDDATFLKYAREKEFHPRVLNYLELNPDSIYRIDDKDTVTCRGWENLSNELSLYEMMAAPIDYKFVRQFIKSDDIATRFFNYYIENLNINKAEIQSIIDGSAGEDIAKKYSAADASTRLNLLQLLQKNLVEETAIPYRKITSYEHLQKLFKTVKDKNIIAPGIGNCGFLTPLDVMNHLIKSNGDTSELSEPAPTPFFGPQALQLDVGDFWNDRVLVKELENLLHEMCAEAELSPNGLATPEDVRKATARQSDRINRFMKSKAGDLKKSWNMITKHIDNIFCFLEKIENGNMYAERFFYFIGHTPTLIRSVTEGNSKEYYKRLDKIYGDNCA